MLTLGLSANARGNSDYGDAAIRFGYRRGLTAGAMLLSFTANWDAVEPTVGSYTLTAIQRLADELAGSTASAQVAIVVLGWDGGKHLPADVGTTTLDAPAVTAALHGLLDALHGVLGGRLAVLLLGTEVEAYLGTHVSEITPFANLVASARTYAQGLSGWAALEVTASFKHSTAATIPTTYADVLAAVTHIGITYYPINGDFTVQHTDGGAIATDIYNDFGAMLADLGYEEVLLTEVGFPSAAGLNSSPSLQAAFVQGVIAVAQAYATVNGADGGPLFHTLVVEWQHDLSEAALDFVGLTGNGRLFLGSLGYRDQNDTQKAGWPILVTALGGSTLPVRKMLLVRT
jgi:hypothetical protein